MLFFKGELLHILAYATLPLHLLTLIFRKPFLFDYTSKEFYLSKEKETFEDFETELIIKEVYLLNSFPKYDIFHFEGRNIISEKLLNAFQENNITGYEVSAYDVLKTE